jgi:ubiquinone/menaquinone biosynthesis C-methylase UbiE
MTNRTRSSYAAWAATYDTDPNPQTALEFAPVLDALAAEPGERVLDAACGTGRYTVPLAERGVDVTGCDFSPEMLAIARRRLPAVEFVEADLSDPLPFADAGFDAVLCGQALKHLPSLYAPMREFARVLRPGARLVFSVTHPDMDWTGYDMKPVEIYVMREHADMFHHRFFDYFDAAEQAGFAVRRVLQLKVDETIRDYLTEESYAAVKGRPQVLVMVLQRGAEGG